MIIDAHIHVGRWRHADFLGRQTDLAGVVAVLEAAGCDGGVLMPTDDYDNQGLWDAIDAARTEVGRALWMVPWVRPEGADDRAATADLDWVEAHAADVSGIKIHPSLSRCRVTDDRFRPALELAASHDLVVIVHCGRWQEMASYRFAIEAALDYPEVRFLLAHAGGDTPPLATAAADMVAERGVDNVWFDFSGLREFWVIERNVARIGSDRYLMGSDFSLAHPLMYRGAVAGMNLSDGDKEAMLGANAVALMGAPMAGSTAGST